jgi:thiamine-phosphate pyrophosphorylase
MTMVPALPRGLYLLTRETADTPTLLRIVGAALDGGAVAVQYRDKSCDAARRLAQARALVALCAAGGVPLIVNDDVALAARASAAGVHLGEHDVPIAEARAVLGATAIIGVSCYDDPARAARLAAQGASYLAFGSFFDSATKPAARRAHPALLHEARRLGLPLAAIGGITATNCGPLVAAGASLLAVISAVFDAHDPRAAAAAIAAHYPTATDRVNG